MENTANIAKKPYLLPLEEPRVSARIAVVIISALLIMYRDHLTNLLSWRTEIACSLFFYGSLLIIGLAIKGSLLDAENTSQIAEPAEGESEEADEAHELTPEKSYHMPTILLMLSSVVSLVTFIVVCSQHQLLPMLTLQSHITAAAFFYCSTFAMVVIFSNHFMDISRSEKDLPILLALSLVILLCFLLVNLPFQAMITLQLAVPGLIFYSTVLMLFGLLIRLAISYLRPNASSYHYSRLLIIPCFASIVCFLLQPSLIMWQAAPWQSLLFYLIIMACGMIGFRLKDCGRPDIRLFVIFKLFLVGEVLLLDFFIPPHLHFGGLNVATVINSDLWVVMFIVDILGQIMIAASSDDNIHHTVTRGLSAMTIFRSIALVTLVSWECYTGTMPLASLSILAICALNLMLTYDVLSPNPPSEQLMQWLYPEALSGGTTTPQQPAPVASFDVDPKEQPKNSSTQATDEPKLSTSSQQLGESTDNPDQPSYGTGI